MLKFKIKKLYTNLIEIKLQCSGLFRKHLIRKGRRAKIGGSPVGRCCKAQFSPRLPALYKTWQR